jgi:predicted ATPase
VRQPIELGELQVAYGNATLGLRGYGAPETSAAFAQARETARSVEGSFDWLSITYGLWAGAYVRGELGPMRDLAESFLQSVAARPDSSEACVAHRIYGVTKWFAGEFEDGRAHLEKALALYDPERDRDLGLHFGQDIGVAATVYLALVAWAQGEVDRARRPIEDLIARIAGISHVGTIAYWNMHAFMFEMMRFDPLRAAPFAEALARFARNHEMENWKAFSVFPEAWIAWHAGDRAGGLAEMRRGMEAVRAKNIACFVPLLRTGLAAAEAEAGEFEVALANLEDAVRNSERTGQFWFDAELYRMRGEILFKQGASHLAPAEESFGGAIAIARRQKARAFELRAALSLAKLYCATGRDEEASAVLRPALEGFAPSGEFSEIEEALALQAKVESWHTIVRPGVETVHSKVRSPKSRRPAPPG